MAKTPRRVVIVFLGFIAIVLIAIGVYSFWLYHRPLPGNIREVLFEGITYIRDVRHEPRPLVIHVVQIDLTTPGLNFFVSPGEPANGYEVRAHYTSQFLDKYDLQLALNGDFFYPWWFHTIFDYYPRLNDPTDINGFAASRGVVYSAAAPDHPTLYISRDNRAQFDVPSGEVYNAISGLPFIVERGQLSSKIVPGEYYDGIHPRTAVALDQTGRTLLLFVVDGRQPNYSEGVSLQELADIVIEYGAYTALNLDGGGSSTLVIEDQQGQPRILNSPIDSSIPGHERPVGNQFGIYAQRLTSQTQ